VTIIVKNLEKDPDYLAALQALDVGDAIKVRHHILKLIKAYSGSLNDSRLEKIFWRMGNSWSQRNEDGEIDPLALKTFQSLDASGFQVEVPVQGTQVIELKAQVREILDLLPPFDYTPRENGEADFYGAIDCIAHDLSLARPPPSNATWTHGWYRGEKFHESHFNFSRNREVKNLVYTQRVRDEMIKLGYTKVHTVGAPILYASQTEVPRIPKSVLAVPLHSTESLAFDHKTPNKGILSAIVDEIGSDVPFAVCVGAKDVLLGNFIHNLESRGIPWITGAWIFDRNALVRMQRIFRSFEYVVTDAIGSHIAYAAYCGCKVVLRDATSDFPSETVLYDKRAEWLKYEEKRPRKATNGHLQEIAPFLFGSMAEAIPQVEWGKQELGHSHKLDSTELAKLLSWDLGESRAKCPDDVDYNVFTQNELIGLAEQFRANGDMVKAIGPLDALLERNPTDGLGNFLKARLLLCCEEYKKAYESITKALNHNYLTKDALQLKTEIEQKLPKGDAFLNLVSSPNTMDLYWQRKSILEAMQRNVPFLEGRFLDVGCGIMPYKDLLMQSPSRIQEYIGLDIETEIYSAEVDLRWDGQTIPLEDASVDSAMATEVLEHCPEPLVVLKEIRRVLKPGGAFFFTVPYIWPLHDAPWDFYRYTPFALKKLLAEAGFEDVEIRALSGWDASLAQMMGLWLKRAPMGQDRRNEMAQKLWPIYQELIATDELPANPEAGNTMSTGWSGLVFAGAEAEQSLDLEVAPVDLPVVIVRSHASNYSETFIEDHVNYVSSATTVVYGWPFPRFLIGGQSVLSAELERELSAALQCGKPVSDALQRAYTSGIAEYLKSSGAQVVLLESGLMGAMWHAACEVAQLPYLVHFHGVDAFEFALLQQWGSHYKLFFKSAAAVVGVSQEMVAQLKDLGADEARLVHGPYGVSVALDALADPAAVAPIFLSVGRFVDKKAPQKTLQAFEAIYRKVPAARLIMVGDGPLLKPCKQWAREQGISEVVTFTGVQSRRAVSRLMSISRVFVQHSVCSPSGDREGLPLAILEAGAHGLPVVSTRHAGIPDAVREDLDGFLVDEGDVKGMAVAMYKLAQDAALAGRMGRSYQARVRSDYSRRVAIGRLQQLITRVVDAHSASSAQAAVALTPEAIDAELGQVIDASEAVRLGAAAKELGAAELAYKCYQHAVSLDRGCGPAYLQMVVQLVQTEAYEDAFLCLKEAARTFELNASALNLLAEMEQRPDLNTPMIQSYRESTGAEGWGSSETPRRILVFTNLLPPQEMGGFGRSVWELCEGLILRGHTVRILTADMPELLQKPYPNYERVERHVKRELRLFGDWKHGAAHTMEDPAQIQEIAVHNVRTILREVAGFRPEVCMAGNLDFMSGAMLDPVLSQGIPIVHRLGNGVPGFMVDATPQSELYCIAGCSTWVNEELQRNGYVAKQFALLPPGSPLQEYYRLMPPAFDRLRICFAGLMMGYKGPHILVEALGFLKKLNIPFTCEFAGDFKDPAYEQYFKQILGKAGIGAQVRLLGFCDRAGLAAMFDRSNVLVMPSVFEEPFGKVQIEAQAAGLAVVRSPVGGYKDMLQDEVNGLLFKREDAEDLARQLYVLQGDPEFWAKLAQQGQVDAFAFTSHRSVETLEQIFEAMLNKKS
jgi:glycosyltransferase involved in cell wall biosynthesis/SAM-dependent methyltransferase